MTEICLGHDLWCTLLGGGGHYPGAFWGLGPHGEIKKQKNCLGLRGGDLEGFLDLNTGL